MSRAKDRWKILTQAITKGQLRCITKSELGIVTYVPLSEDWYRVHFNLHVNSLHGDANSLGDHDNSRSPTSLYVDIRLRPSHCPISLQELTGFNNTGNVKVWPSEECMAEYCIHNYRSFAQKDICELGAGMTGLAGIALSMVSDISSALISDGNDESVRNIDRVIDRNRAQLNGTVWSKKIVWGQCSTYFELKHSFDVILSADCLFFDEARTPLLQTIVHLLKPGGVCYIFAPYRKGTFDQFYKLCHSCNHFDETSIISLDLYQNNNRNSLKIEEQQEKYPMLLKLVKK